MFKFWKSQNIVVRATYDSFHKNLFLILMYGENLGKSVQFDIICILLRLPVPSVYNSAIVSLQSRQSFLKLC